MDITIRRADSKDFPLLAKMDEAIFPEGDTFAEEDFGDEDYENFLILIDNSAVGSIVLAHNKSVAESFEDDLPPAEGTLYIISTALLPKFQRIGLGSIMKAWQIAYAQIKKFKKIVTNARKSNKGSIALNKKFGFKVIRTLPNYYHSPKEDAIAMELSL